MKLFFTIIVPLLIWPIVMAAIAFVAFDSILPSSSKTHAAALFSIVVFACGLLDRSTHLTDYRSLTAARQFALKITLYNFIAVMWAAGGFLLGNVMEMNPPWPAVPALIAGIVHARKLLQNSGSGEPTEAPEHERGRELYEIDQVRDIQNQILPVGDPGIEWGGAKIPSYAATGGFMIVGIVGSGKTLTIRLLMQQVFTSSHLAADRRAVIYDAKGDMLPILYGLGLSADIHIMNPFDARSVAWDLAKDITDLAAAQELAHIMIPESKDGNQPYFPNAARQLLTTLVLTLSRKCGSAWTLRDLILGCEGTHLQKILESDADNWWRVRDYFSAKELPSVLTTLSSQMARFEPVAAAWEQARHRISLSEWAKSNSILVLGFNPTVRSAVNALNQILVERLSEILLGQPDSATRRTWIFLDEFRSTGQFSGLSELITRGRSKGSCVVLGFQDINGLNEAYGENVAAELTGQCWQKAFLRVDDNATAEWASLSLGEEERWEYDSSTTTRDEETSRTVERRRVTRRIITPGQLKSLPPAGEANGLPGCYVAAHLGAYRYTLPGRLLKSRLMPLASDVLGFEQRRGAQVISRWNEDDLRRLRLHALDKKDPLNGNTHSIWDVGRINRPVES